MLKGAEAQAYAISMEHILCSVFKCERFGVAGVVNSDFIRRHPLTAVTATCTYILATANSDKRKQIERFLSENTFYLEFTLDELLSFETSEKTIGITTYQLNYENGKEAIEDIISKFREICV